MRSKRFIEKIIYVEVQHFYIHISPYINLPLTRNLMIVFNRNAFNRFFFILKQITRALEEILCTLLILVLLKCGVESTSVTTKNVAICNDIIKNSN